MTIRTVEEFRRAAAAKFETEKLLKKELGYLPHLRKPETIRFYREHIAKLETAINAYRGRD